MCIKYPDYVSDSPNNGGTLIRSPKVFVSIFIPKANTNYKLFFKAFLK